MNKQAKTNLLGTRGMLLSRMGMLFSLYQENYYSIEVIIALNAEYRVITALNTGRKSNLIGNFVSGSPHVKEIDHKN